MNRHYADILAMADALGRAPLWFDEAAVPRFCEFAPDEIADIYASECCLLAIACQACGQKFAVAMSSDGIGGQRSLTSMAHDKVLFYGDPPNVECCPSGPTMSSDTVCVLQFWRRGHGDDWQRVPELEGHIYGLEEQ